MINKKLITSLVNRVVFVQRRSMKQRSFSRTPLRILTKEEAIDVHKRPLKPNESSRRATTKDRLKTFDRKDGIFGKSFKYENMGESDERFIKMMISVKNKKAENISKILLEGRRLIIDAIEMGVTPDVICFTSEENLIGIPFKRLPDDVVLFKTSQKQMQTWSDLTTCPGIMGIFKKPDYDNLQEQNDSGFPVSIVCDNIREPGNMGSILRCAAAVGCSQVYITKGCVDVWDTKVLRTGCGAHFRVPVRKIDWEDVENYVSSDTAVYIADNCQTTAKSQHNAKNDTAALDVPSLPYSSVSYGDCNSVVIIGGETEGLSEEARELSRKRSGIRIFIPMKNNVDSLNSAMALSIILFEMERQNREFRESNSQ